MNPLTARLSELGPEAHAALRAGPARRRSTLEMALDGRQAEDLLHPVGATVDRNAVRFGPRPPMVTSGLRIGTPAPATRGFTEDAFAEVADIVALALCPGPDLPAPRARTEALAAAHPLHPRLPQDGDGAR